MLINTKYWQEEGLKFMKYGYYTEAPKGTSAYRDYWMEQDRRCREGYMGITGTYYFYLNFYPILAKDEVTGRKTRRLPRVLDIDKEYFEIVDKARKEKKGVIMLKPRRTGFSFKNSALCVHEYNFFKEAKCIIGAYMSELSKHTMQMCLDGLNHLDKQTAWVKPRNPDTRDHVKARHQVTNDGVTTWRGYNSEIFTLTFKDNPFAAIGKSSNIFLFEEAGKFDNLISSYNIAEPCWKDGADMIGLPILFGTGGDMEGGTRDFAEMFYNPEKYNLLSFDNEWEEGKSSTCGWFVPATRGNLGSHKGVELVDADGNSNQDMAADFIKVFRDSKNNGDPKAIRDAITQYPLTPSEAFLRSKGSIFPIADLQEHLSIIETNKEKRNAGIPMELIIDTSNKVVAKPNHDLHPITDFPLKADDRKDGAVIMWEEPYKDASGNIPYGLYIAGCDPIDQDKADSSTSLGSIFVYKTFVSPNETHNIIVAEYTGRREKADDFYEICRRLLLLYNARCLYENQLKGLKGYFEMKQSLHLLYEQPQILKDIVKDSKVQRGYGIHMNRGTGGATGIKDQCELYLKQWLLEERVIDPEKGISVMNLHTILSIPLLKELISYDPEGNYDRVIAFMLCILQSKENHKIHVQEYTNVPVQQYWNNMSQFFKKNNRF